MTEPPDFTVAWTDLSQVTLTGPPDVLHAIMKQAGLWVTVGRDRDRVTLPVTWPHYWSTYCIHDLHSDCRLSCKTCQSPCRCPCHTEATR